MTFRQLYEFLKSHKEYVFNKNIPQSSCLCEICENIVFVAKGINKALIYNEKALPTNPHDIVEKLSCDSSSQLCMLETCETCETSHLSINDFKNGENITTSSNDSSEDEETDYNVSYYEWSRGDDGKIKKVLANVEPEEAIEVFNKQLSALKKHIFTKRQLAIVYNDIKNRLKPGELLVNVDFSENYENKQQDEIQSAYFGHTTFSLFTACCYLKTEENGELVKENVTITSEAPDHSRIAAFSCVNSVIDFVKNKYFELFRENIVVHIWSDGCAAQFRSRYVFSLMTNFDPAYDISWYYNERHHGKGPMDGIGGTVKNLVFRHVKSGKILINTPKEFSTYADKIIDGVTSLYLAADEVLEEPAETENAPKIHQTLQIHKVKRLYDNHKVCYLKFYKIASDEVPMFKQYYRKDTDPEICGHNDGYTNDNTCGYCSEHYVTDGSEWLECPLCKKWFHEKCFEL